MPHILSDATQRNRLSNNRRLAETFEIEVAGLRYTATVGRFSDGHIGEVFLQRALLRDSHGCPSTPLGAAIDAIARSSC
jgi:hypothetical protein